MTDPERSLVRAGHAAPVTLGQEDSTGWPLITTLRRHRYVVLTVLALAVWIGGAATLPAGSDWEFFTWGGGLLFGQHRDFVRPGEFIPGDAPGGLHLYANYRSLQIGPPALVLGRLLAGLPGGGAAVAAGIVMLLGLLAVYAVERALRGDRHRSGVEARVLLGGSLVIVAWGSIAQQQHVDDALALAGGCLGGWCLRGQRSLMAGGLLGLAAASKPWAVVLLPLALLLPTQAQRLRALVMAVAVVALFWLPFVVADVGTLNLGQVRFVPAPDSALATLPPVDLLHDPERFRLLQLGGGLALSWVLVWRRRWELAPLAAFAWRLGLDPATYRYYGVALILAGLVADLGRPSRQRLPVLTSLTIGSWLVAGGLPESGAAVVRLIEYPALVLFALGSALVRPGRRRCSTLSGAAPRE